MYQSLRDLPTNVLKEDPLFASDLSAVLSDSGIELVQDQTNFTVYVEGLEKLFHAGSLKQFTKDNKGPNAPKLKKAEPKKTSAPLKTSQPTPDKGAKRKEQDGKDGPRNLKLKDNGLCVETSSQQRVVSLVADVDTTTPTRLGSAEFAGQSLIRPRTAHAQKNPTRSEKNPRRDPRAKPRLEQELRQSRLRQGLPL